MKILIIRLSSLGDIVLTEPVVSNLLNLYPNSQLHYITKNVFIPLLDAFPNKPHKIFSWQNKKQVIKALRNEKYDLVVDLHGKLNTLIIKKLILPKKTITYKKKHFLRRLITKKLTSKKINSTLDLYNSIFKKLNHEFEHRFPNLKPPENYTEHANKLFKNYSIKSDKINIAIIPGATHNTKRYPANKIIRLINLIPKHWNCQIILLGSHNEKKISTKIKRKSRKKVFDLCGATKINSLIGIISKMDIVISNDSGPMHIAAALKKHQIALFGATHTDLGFKPLNTKAVILQKNIKCQPCSLHGGKECPKGHFQCMHRILPINILSVLQNKINDLIIKETIPQN